MVNESVNSLVIEFRLRLLNWGVNNTHKYPWRWNDNPYHVLVSEFMLHRTQTKQVVAVYNRFITEYPTLEAFVVGNRIRARDLLNALGLHWRIQGMLSALSQIREQYREVPLDQEKLMQIEGIGQYIASATVCFTKNEPVTLIDTNIVRVVGRVFGLDLSGEARRRKSVVDAIETACDPVHPRDYYYAMIDFAHQVCTFKTPACENCPLLNLPCHYGKIASLTTRKEENNG